MKKRPKILVVGSLMMNQGIETSVIPEEGQTVMGEDIKKSPGGKGANQAVQMARPAYIKDLAEYAKPFVSIGNQTGEGWFLTGEMVELIHSGAPNIVCTQPFACLPNHVVGKGVIKEIRQAFPDANIVAIDYDPGASEVNQINRIKLMLSAAEKNMNK